MNIYQTTQAYQTVLAKANAYAEDNEGETCDHLEQLLEQLGEDKEEALLGLAYEIKNHEAEADALKNAGVEIASKAKTVKERIEKKKILLANLTLGQAITDGVIKIPKASSKSLVVYGEVPKKYVNTVNVPAVPATTKDVRDNATIKKDLLSGDLIADWAKIVEKKSVK